MSRNKYYLDREKIKKSFKDDNKLYSDTRLARLIGVKHYQQLQKWYAVGKNKGLPSFMEKIVKISEITGLTIEELIKENKNNEYK